MGAKPGLLTTLADRSIIGGVAGFTKLGFRARRKSWQPLRPSLEGRTIVITGATSGLGEATAMRLAQFGPRLVIVGRNQDKLDRVARDISRVTGNDSTATMLADLSDMTAVRKLAERLIDEEHSIHCLINNAGALFTERSETADGIELTLATNLLSPFLLTNMLLGRLEASAPARVVNVSSGGMYTQGISLTNLQSDHGEYDGARAYARAKRGQVILTEMWAEMLDDTAVTVNAMHPGWADTPGLDTSLPGFRRFIKALLRSAEEGADTIVWLAAAPEAAALTGGFFLDRKPHVTNVLPGTELDEEGRAELWERLAELSGWEGPGPTG